MIRSCLDLIDSQQAEAKAEAKAEVKAEVKAEEKKVASALDDKIVALGDVNTEQGACL